MIRKLHALPILLLLGGGLQAQSPTRLDEARLPRRGHLWLEVLPSVQSWSAQYAENSPDPLIPDGGREPLFRDVDGPILDRIFPGPKPGLLASLNAAAPALGIQPLSEEEFSAGELEFGNLRAEVRRVDVGLRFGILDRLSLELEAPLVSTELESFFVFDTVAATVARASFALPGGESFLGDLAAARSSLQGLVDGGSLSPEDRQAALELLQQSDLFLAALGTLIAEDAFLPLGSSPAGGQLLSHVDALSMGFGSFGVSLPEFPLRGVASLAALQNLFTGDPLFGVLPEGTGRSFRVGEIAVGTRFRLWDSYADSARSLRFRTTLGGRFRLPIRDPSRPPFANPALALDLPIGAGTRSLEVGAFQDLRVGRFVLNAQGLLGLSMADRVTRRVHPPDRPFATPATESRLRRSPGNTFRLRIAPRYSLTDLLSLGLDYDFWHKGADRHELVSAGAAVTSADPLDLETRQRRQSLGIGVFFAADDPARGESSRAPWWIGLTFRTPISGSGGQTPVAQFFQVILRIPI